ncbi:LOW QUALITY PROTEIN: cationic peroxidase 1-like [Asparagus officinalis]|uniref:LOW QUALITY PROTEIN: cationic peroxidase 1-like n=1 Tax=Asparagus officinalis TaxID=4686 RepID=UPI00098E75DF|nr:LOW QUALITY PROTEIN: cationic peroxidase 1-like [Asparagus officinalis]
MAILQASFKFFLLVSFVESIAFAELTPDFYDEVCPEALDVIKEIVEEAIAAEPRMGASLLRLHFHDCFVNGCDGSILLDDTPTFTGEKTAGPNNNSVRGYDVIDQIKMEVNTFCLGNVVSCADIVAVAARDSVFALGGPYYQVLLGRRDSTTAGYYSNLVQMRGLLHADQELFKGDGGDVEDLVQFYSENVDEFWGDFGDAMIRMGNLSPLMGEDGVIRENCRLTS